MTLSLRDKLAMLMPPSLFYRRRIAQEAASGEPELAVLEGGRATIARDRPVMLLELLSGTYQDPGAETAAICTRFGYDAFLVQYGEKIAALPAIAALGKNTTWGTEIETRNVLFVPR